MRKVFALRTGEGLSLVAHVTTKSYGAFGNPSAQPFLAGYWADDLAEEEATAQARRWAGVTAVTRKARDAARAALREGPPPRARADVEWLAESLEFGALCAEGTQRYYELYALAQRLVARGEPVRKSYVAGAHKAVLSLAAKIKKMLRAKFPRNTIDPVGGDRRQKEKVLESLVERSDELVRGLQTGRCGGRSKRTWW